MADWQEVLPLACPEDWEDGAAALDPAARAEVTCDLNLTVTGGRPFGQVAEALVTVGGRAWCARSARVMHRVPPGMA